MTPNHKLTLQFVCIVVLNAVVFAAVGEWLVSLWAFFAAILLIALAKTEDHLSTAIRLARDANAGWAEANRLHAEIARAIRQK